MRKKRLVVAVIATVVLIAMLSGIASAWFTDTATATMSGKTGNVSIQTHNVTLTQKFQPGDIQYFWLKVHNNGTCPIKITSATILFKPPWLGVIFAKKPLNQIFNHCESKYFKLYVYMPASATKPQNASFWFQIRFHAQNVPTTWPTTPKL